ncbi:MAG: hypothetical protein AB9856_13305 [Cellulosilyticaceae bacterium]
MADNGDYYRIISGNGLYSLQKNYSDQYFGYFNKEYGIYEYFNENEDIIITSQSLFIKVASILDKAITKDNIFDLRFLGLVQSIYCITMIYFLMKCISYEMHRKMAYVFSFLVPFVFIDTAYTAYFNSFYSEGIVYISCIFSIIAIILMIQQQYNDYFLMVLFVLNGIILTTSKQQNAPNGVLLGILILSVVWIRRESVFKVIATVMGGLLIMVGIGTYIIIPKEFVNINQYHAMTRGILLINDNPEAVLEKFNISKQYSVLKDSIYYERYHIIDANNQLLKEGFYDQYGFIKILIYYIKNPTKLIQMLELAAKNAFTIRPRAMGNFEKIEGRPYLQKTNFFSLYSILKDKLVPKTIGFIVIWMIVIIGFYSYLFIKANKNKDRRKMMGLPVMITIIAIGLVQIVVSIIGAGDADLLKHIFLFNVIFDLVNILFIADIIKNREKRFKEIKK